MKPKPPTIEELKYSIKSLHLFGHSERILSVQALHKQIKKLRQDRAANKRRLKGGFKSKS